MRSYQVLDASECDGQIASARGGLSINSRHVPLEDVAVLLVGSRTLISGGALTMLSQYDVTLLNLDWRGVTNFTGFGWSQNSRVAARHRAQASLSEPRRKSAWQQIVKAKITGQANNLELFGSVYHNRLRNLVAEVRSGDPGNLEGQAARLYWRAWSDDSTWQRDSDGSDETNAMLNYGYAVLRGFVIQAICHAGLSPTLGLWHRNRGNAFCLADDLIEPFRPAVDATVYSLGKDADVNDPAVKKALVETSRAPISTEGTTLATSIFNLAIHLAKYVEGDSKKLAVPVWTFTNG